MVTKQINAEQFRKMVQAASLKLNQNAKFINSLNVFPVPDGDTGTNMSLSMASGAKYVANSTSDSVGHLTDALAKGLLMGARGNSGVILSQIFRGFNQAVGDKSHLTTRDLTRALMTSAKVAYQAVMKPTEGTILTVIRAAAQSAKDSVSKVTSVSQLLKIVSQAAQAALKKTPDLLPVLKKVGVVDSGGQGLTLVLQAFSEVADGRPVKDSQGHLTDAEMDEMVKAVHHRSAQSQLNPADIKYGYCTQMMVRLGRGKEVDRKFSYQPFYDHLAKLGNSLLVVHGYHVVKVHVHTEHPGKVLAWGQHFGDLVKIKIDNMRNQQESIINRDAKRQPSQPKPRKTAVVAVVSGKGLRRLFRSLGVTRFVSGGQTMNPSTAEILRVVNVCRAKQVVILPNNGNVYLAAKQAAEQADLPATVVHCKTINQGLAVMLGYNPDASLRENYQDMSDNLSEVKSGAVTYATRDTQMNGQQIKKGQYLGIADGRIVAADDRIVSAAFQMVKAMLDSDSEVVTIIYGRDENQADAKRVETQVKHFDSELETEVHAGDQPVYPFLVSVE